MPFYVFEYRFRPTPPYCFSCHLRCFSIPGEPVPFIYDDEGKSCRRLFVLKDRVSVAYSVSLLDEPWSPLIEARILATNGGIARRVFDNILLSMRAYFDYNDFVERLSDYPVLKELAEKYPGIRPGRSLSLYDALLESIIKQRIALRAALRVHSRLVRSYGAHVNLNGIDYYSNPLPENLARASVDELRSKGLTRLKAEALKSLAEAELEGRLPSIEDAVKRPWEVAEELTSLRGVGRWTGELAVAMVHPEFPIGPTTDLAVRRGLEQLYKGKLGKDTIRALVEDLREYAGLIMYLASHEYESLKQKT